MHLVNKRGDVINLDKVELGGLPAEVVKQIQVLDPNSFTLLKSIQSPIVLTHMTTAYTLVFVFCALAYLIAWGVMHLLVPKFKKIELS
jgi:ACS family hexuronate transporter-like MFS transporter